jgi:hypothetical protein
LRQRKDNSERTPYTPNKVSVAIPLTFYFNIFIASVEIINLMVLDLVRRNNSMNGDGLRRFMPVVVIGVIVVAVLAVIFLIIRPGGDEPEMAAPAATTAPSALSGNAATIAQQRGLTPDDITAALKTYMPTGTHDDYLMFASGGHSGQMCCHYLYPAVWLIHLLWMLRQAIWFLHTEKVVAADL